MLGAYDETKHVTVLNDCKNCIRGVLRGEPVLMERKVRVYISINRLEAVFVSFPNLWELN